MQQRSREGISSLAARRTDTLFSMLRAGHIIALCVIALLTVGVVMVNSAGMTVPPAFQPTAQTTVQSAALTARQSGEAASHGSLSPSDGVTARSIILSRSTVYMAMAIAAMGVGAFLPIRRLAAAFGRPDVRAADGSRGTFAGLMPLLVGVVGLIGVMALVYTPLVGKEVNGSHRWLRLPIPGLGDALSMQPSEIAKWGMVGVMAWYCATRALVMPRFFRGLLPGLIAVAAVAGCVIIEDLGTGILILTSACLILLASGARVLQFLMFVPVGLAGLVAAVLHSPYRIDRITAFLDPYSDPKKTGYHMIQSMLAVAGGEGAGRGLGHGQQKFGYLPEDQTDFLFAIVCEELGIAGAAVVIALFAALIWCGYSIIRRESEPVLKLLALGIMSTVGLQAIINLVVVTGLGPTKGIALPLVSSGGTGWILTAFSLGLVIAIDRSRPAEEVSDTIDTLAQSQDSDANSNIGEVAA